MTLPRQYHVAHLSFLRSDIVEAAANRQPIFDKLLAYTQAVVEAEHDRVRDGLLDVRSDLEAGEVGGALRRIRGLFDAEGAVEG